VLRVAVLAAGLVALAVPAAASAYGWPLRPFDRQHAIRGGFDDPREQPKLSGFGWTRQFHFGVDISATAGTPVFAVAPGTVYNYADAVAVRQRGGHELSYWHVAPAAREHSYIATGQLVGWVRAGWDHVHLAESEHGTYLNPLRPGALTPYADTTVPVVSSIELRRRGSTKAIDPSDVTGTVDVVAVADDPPPIVPHAPWQTAAFVPALIRWRLTGPDGAILPWQTAVDFRLRCLRPSLFPTVYAPDTRQNRMGVTGYYAFWLDRDLDASAFEPGDYRIDVQATDIRGNTGTGTFAFTILPALQSRKTT
jgi:Peptidase family M23